MMVGPTVFIVRSEKRNSGSRLPHPTKIACSIIVRFCRRTCAAPDAEPASLTEFLDDVAVGRARAELAVGVVQRGPTLGVISW